MLAKFQRHSKLRGNNNRPVLFLAFWLCAWPRLISQFVWIVQSAPSTKQSANSETNRVLTGSWILPFSKTLLPPVIWLWRIREYIPSMEPWLIDTLFAPARVAYSWSTINAVTVYGVESEVMWSLIWSRLQHMYCSQIRIHNILGTQTVGEDVLRSLCLSRFQRLRLVFQA